MYIIQNMQQFSKLDYIFNDNNYYWYFEKEKNNIIDIGIETLFKSNNKRYMIIAEPGYGKTRLLKEIVIQSQNNNKEAFFIDAKKIGKNSIEESLKKCKLVKVDELSEEELQKQSRFKNNNKVFKLDEGSVVCIDALDEVMISDLYELFEKIDDFIETYQDTRIVLSCRTHHLKKIKYDFEILDFKFITLSAFNGDQIKHFLEKKLNTTIDLDELYDKSKISNIYDFISTPRYLYYFSELLQVGSLKEVIGLSRAKMFEHFIYRKLDKELHDNTQQSQIDILKRVLEKLALIMKIKGTSEITKDELLSVFDKMDSNFSQITFRDDLLAKLYDRSLLKDNIDTVEFENQEFLDYLCAKELARFEKVEQVFFDLAIEPNILEMYTSWFYVLPFVLELKPSIIDIFLNFVEKNSHRALNAEYFKALTSVEVENIPTKLKSKIFNLVFDYYTVHSKWLWSSSSSILKPLARYYDESKYPKIVGTIDGRKNKDKLIVLRTNAIELISELIEEKKLNNKQIEYWKRKSKEWLKLNPKENQALQRHIVGCLSALAQDNFKWIKSLYFIFENGIELQGEYARACFKVAPNDIFSIDVYFDTYKFFNQNKKDRNLSRINNEYDYILQLNTVDAVIYAFTQILDLDNKNLLHYFCDSLKYMDGEKRLENFSNNLEQLMDNKLLGFLKKSIEKLLENDKLHYQSCIKLYQIFLGVVLKEDKEYLKKTIETMYRLYGGKHWHRYHSLHKYLILHINEDNIDKFIEYFDISKEEKKKYLINLYFYSGTSESVKGKIKKIYKKQIDKQEKAYEENQKEDLFYCKDWEEQLEPEKGKFSTELFNYFNGNKSLKKCPKYDENIKIMMDIAVNWLESYNPLDGKIEKNGTGATVYTVYYYKDLIEFLHLQNLKLSQKARDNVFRYLPFDMNTEYETTLAVAKNPSPKAIQDIVDVYGGKRADDLGVYYVRQFVEVYNKIQFREMELVLLQMLKNDDIAEYEKEYIAENLPTNVLTIKIINQNRNKIDTQSSLYETYLSILIKKHKDKDAIDEAFEWTKNKATEAVSSFGDPLNRTENKISSYMVNVDYELERDKELLLLSSILADSGKEGGSNMLKEVVKNHLTYMIETNTDKAHETLNEIEQFIMENNDKKDLHWFEYSLQELKQAYLNKIQDTNIISAIKKYNKLQKEDYIPIVSAKELLEVLKATIEEEIKKWIEDEGAYKHIEELSKKQKNKNAEDFIQKSIKSQIELALLKRGFRETDYKFIIKREEQLLDDKRLDFTVSYGFIGSVMIELKLSDNDEAIPTRKTGKEYPKKLQKYLNGSSSDYGLFVIFNIQNQKNKFDSQIRELHQLYSDEENITVMGLNCVI